MLKKEIIILFYALKDKRTSLLAKLPTIFAVFYLASPIDLIPDFIPFAGLVDDLVLVPLLLNLSIRILPAAVLEDSLKKAATQHKKIQWFTFFGLILLISVLVGFILLLRYFIHKI